MNRSELHCYIEDNIVVSSRQIIQYFVSQGKTNTSVRKSISRLKDPFRSVSKIHLANKAKIFYHKAFWKTPDYCEKLTKILLEEHSVYGYALEALRAKSGFIVEKDFPIICGSGNQKGHIPPELIKQNLLDSDFHNKQLDKPIEIVVTIDISDVADSDCQKLRAQLKGALLSEHNKVHIKLFAEYSKTEMLALPILSWGGDINHLYEMKQRGYLYEIDYVFNVIYIDSYVDLYSLFKKNVSQLVRNEKDEDKDILAKIQNTVDDLNGHIASLSGIKEFEDKLDEVVLENAKVIELTGNNVFCRNLYEARRTNEYVQS